MNTPVSMPIIASRLLARSTRLLLVQRAFSNMTRSSSTVKLSDMPTLGDKGLASRLSIYQGEQDPL